MRVSYGHGRWQTPTASQQRNSYQLANRCGDSGIGCRVEVERYVDEETGQSRTRTNFVPTKDYTKYYDYRMRMTNKYPRILAKYDPPEVVAFYENLISQGVGVEKAKERTWKEKIVPTYNPATKDVSKSGRQAKSASVFGASKGSNQVALYVGGAVVAIALIWALNRA